jgi:hypothetical protein
MRKFREAMGELREFSVESRLTGDQGEDEVMDEKLRITAVKDVLSFCRKLGHQMNEGRTLAPVLIGRPWNGEQDDDLLAEAMQALLRRELAGLRQRAGLNSDVRSNPQSPKEYLLRDLRTKNKELSQLSKVWAYYIDEMTTQQIRKLYPRPPKTPRTIQLHLNAGRAQVAQLVKQLEQASTPVVQPVEQWLSVPKGASVPQTSSDPKSSHDKASSSNGTPPSIPSNSAPSVQRRGRRRSRPRLRPSTPSQQYVSGVGHTVLSNVRGPIVIRNKYASPPNSAPAVIKPAHSQSDRLTVWMIALVILTLAWLIIRQPQLGAGILAALILPMATWHCAVSARSWARATGEGRAGAAEDIRLKIREDAWWDVCQLVPWLVLAGLAIFTAMSMSPAIAAPQFSWDRVTHALRCLALATGLFWLGGLDMFLWVGRTRQLDPPWDNLRPYGEWVVKARWEATGLCWIVLFILCVTMMVAGFMIS